MLIDTDALVKHASAVRDQGQEVKALLENHRAELQKAKEHFIKDHRVLVDGLSALQKELDEAIAKIAGAKPAPEKETTDGTQEG